MSGGSQNYVLSMYINLKSPKSHDTVPFNGQSFMKLPAWAPTANAVTSKFMLIINKKPMENFMIGSL